MLFYVGLHQPFDARHFDRAFISINRLKRRRSDFVVGSWILDSGGFSEISIHGHYRADVVDYARAIRRWSAVGTLELAVAQDYMCEAPILVKTGLTIPDHQRLTIERFDALLDADPGAAIMPVLQGFDPEDYARHLDQYGDRLATGMRVGVGSVCKRNGQPGAIMAVLERIAKERPDLRLHGFGLKKTAIESRQIGALLFSADSMAWSYHARINGRSGNDWREAKAYEEAIAFTRDHQDATPTLFDWVDAQQ